MSSHSDRRSSKGLCNWPILYSEIDKDVPDGEFVYIRPVLQGTDYENVDELSTELQFEAYCTLGARAVEEICEATERNVNFVQEFVQAARVHVVNPSRTALRPHSF